jgi:hypothetical protein
VTRSVTSESAKTARKTLLVLPDSITGDIVLNDESSNARSITMIDIKNSQEVNRLMQPCDFKMQSITSLYHIVRDQSADASLTSNINRDGTHKQIGGRSANAALFTEELVRIYSTPTPRVLVCC